MFTLSSISVVVLSARAKGDAAYPGKGRETPSACSGSRSTYTSPNAPALFYMGSVLPDFEEHEYLN